MDIKQFLSISKEFLRALLKGHTYDVRKNWYVLFGVLWGIPVPVVTIGIALSCSGSAPSIQTITNEILSRPIQLFFLLHPLIFGMVFGAMGTVRDDKEKQKDEFEKNLIRNNMELAVANKKLQELDNLKDNFLSMVSHELRTPLTTVQGYVTLVKEDKPGTLTDEQKHALAIAEERADYLNNLIGDLVDLSRMESGEFNVELEPTDLIKVAVRITDSLKRSCEEKGITLKKALPKSPFMALVDQKRIEQVFTNIIENAIKFNQPGGKITISAQEGVGRIKFIISDTGIGIPQEQLGKVFDRFYQVDSAARRKYGGCGLGLAITKSIIELHGGKIWVESEPGSGSKFFFELKKDGDADQDYII